MRKLKRGISTILAFSLLLCMLPFTALTVSAARSVKTQKEAITWLNAQDGAEYNFSDFYDEDGNLWGGTQCVEFVRAYVNWLVNGNAWTDAWDGATGNGDTIWQNSLWSRLGWNVYYNDADFVPQPGDIFSSGGCHTGVVISSDVYTAVVADSNARNSNPYDGDSTWIHTITWASATSGRAYGATHFIRPNFASDAHTHSYTSSVTKNPACTTSGQRTYTCSCGDRYVETIPATGHKWNSGEIITAAGCISDGIRKYTCTVCAETYTSAVSPTGHTIVKDDAVEATCVTTGLTEGSHCSVCAAIVQSQEIVPALGHDYQLSEAKASCISVTSTYTCSRCNDSYEETSYGYVWSDWSEVKPEGITEENIESKTQYRYSEKSTTQSSSSSLSGWTKYDTQITGWTNWSSWQNSKVTESASREVKTQYISPTYKTVWHYSRSVSPDGTSSSYGTSYYPNSQSITLDYQLSAKGSVDGYTHYGPYDGGYGTYLQNYWWNERSESVVDKAGYTQYSYRDAVYTYYFYKWSEMSEWQDEEIAASADTNVEIRTLFRYRLTPTGHKPGENWMYDSKQHWHECSECQTKIDLSEHLYDNDQDVDCNTCGSVREVKKPVSENEPQVIVETKKAGIGKTVEIQVLVKNNPGIWGIGLVVEYDKTQLTLASVTNGTVFSSSEWTQGNLSGDKYILSYEASGFEDITANGVLATLVFTVNENATVDSFSKISVSYQTGDIINVSFDDIEVAIFSGGVNVIDFIYGDLNGDGLVNKKDSLLMKMYLADNSTSIDMQAADVYADGSINKKDSLYLKQFLAGWDVELGA